MARDDRQRVRDRIKSIEREREELSDFREFGASDDLDYRMTDARAEALLSEKEKLQEILGDL
jgi:hypothetical protein